MKALIIPNDATSAYFRNTEKDFLSEVNPQIFFNETRFLNWKDEKDTELFGVKSKALLNDKKEARNLMSQLAKGNLPFSSPLFTDLFLKEQDKIKEFLRKYNPDIIRAFNTHFAGELGVITRDISKAPLIISAHDISRLTSIIHQADYLVCISQALKEKCINEYGVAEEEITIIPDGINMGAFYKQGNKTIANIVPAQYLNAHYKTISVGRVVESKNIETLINAINLVKQEIPNITHLHLGAESDSEKTREVKKLKSELGLDRNFYFLGPKQKEQFPAFYSWADVYALPTLWEGLGRASIEALACETPVITTNYAPMTEVVQNGYNGLTVNPKDHEALAQGLLKLLTDKKYRQTLSANARKSIQKYDINKVMQMHVGNYKRILKK